MVENYVSLLEYPVGAVELNGLCASCRTDLNNTEWFEMLTLVCLLLEVGLEALTW